MPVTKQIQLDLINPGEPPRIYAKQGENLARNIEIRLFADGEPWIIPPDCTPVIRYYVHSLEDGRDATGIYDSLPNGHVAYQTEENRIRFTPISGMLSRHGIVQVDVAFIHGEEILATFNLEIYVAKAPATGTEPQTQSYYRVATLDQINAALDSYAGLITNLEQNLGDIHRDLATIRAQIQALQSRAGSAAEA